MKYLLVAVVLIIAIGIWRNNRRKAAAPPPAPPKPHHPKPQHPKLQKPERRGIQRRRVGGTCSRDPGHGNRRRDPLDANGSRARNPGDGQRHLGARSPRRCSRVGD